MKIISHRGNLEGPNLVLENHPEYIDKAISQGFKTEIDLRVHGQGLYLGHDHPSYEIDIDWLYERRLDLYIHAKTIHTLNFLINYLKTINERLNVFYHTDEDAVLTSIGEIWLYPGVYCSHGITVTLEHPKDTIAELALTCAGICTDFPKAWQEHIKDLIV